MLYDRPYMRQPLGRGGWPWTYKLMLANAVVFVLQSVLVFWGSVPVAEYFALSPMGLAHGFVWQLLTFQFLHDGLWHLLLNMVVVFFFGRPIEEALGSRRMLQLYFLSGVVGGICQVLFQVVLGLLWNKSLMFGGVVGASAGAFGLVAAFATLFPDRRITLLLFFVIPLSMRAKTLLWISVGLGLFGLLVPSDGVAHAAHLGGILAAVLFIRTVVVGGFQLPTFRLTPRAKRRAKVTVLSGSVRGSPMAPPDEEFSDDFIAREVDPILDKISAHGIQSLTERERRILQAARNRMQKR